MLDLTKIKEIANEYSEPWKKLIFDLLKSLVINSDSGEKPCRLDLYWEHYADGLGYRYVAFGIKKKSCFTIGEETSVEKKNGFLAFLKSQLATILKLPADSFSLTYDKEERNVWLAFKRLD